MKFKYRLFYGMYLFIYLTLFTGSLYGIPVAFWEKQVQETVGNYDFNRIKSDLTWFATLDSRVSGYPGCDRAADYIYRRFTELGLIDVSRQEYDVTVPVVKSATLNLSGQTYRLFPVWPNLVHTSQTPPEGLTGPIVYVGYASLPEFDGKPILNSIVFCEFNCYTDWLNAGLLGAQAVVFIEPETTTTNEAVTKFLQVPAKIPRYYIKRNDWNKIKRVITPSFFSSRRFPARLRRSVGNPPHLNPLPQGERISTGTIKCTMRWERRKSANVIGLIEGRAPVGKNEVIVLTAYYDTISVVPELSPGADQTLGIATLLELARVLKQTPSQRSVLLVANGAHFINLAGVRQFINLISAKRQMRYKISTLQQTGLVKQYPVLSKILPSPNISSEKEPIPLIIGLDLSSHSPQLGLFHCGMYYWAEHLTRFFSPLGKHCTSLYKRIQTLNLFSRTNISPRSSEELFIDCINPSQEKKWVDRTPAAYDTEYAVRAGLNAVTLATINDLRESVDTPTDTMDRLNWDNVRVQTVNLVSLITAMVAHPESTDQALHRLNKLRYELEKIKGTVLEFRSSESFLPNTPVPHSLIVVRNGTAHRGVRLDTVELTDETGNFELEGVRGGNLECYKLDERNGEISYTTDLGPEGARKYSLSTGGRRESNRPIIAFPCRAITLYDTIDTRYFQTIPDVHLLDAQTDSEPLRFGISRPERDPCCVLYTDPYQRVKLILSSGIFGKRMLLLNSTADKPEGNGFIAGDTVVYTPYQSARDLFYLNDYRIRRFNRYGITNERLTKLHTESGEILKEADTAIKSANYTRGLTAARAALSLASRAYPDVDNTAQDVVKGILFYLAMTIPFAYFIERIVFAYTDIRKQIFATGLVFLVVFFLLQTVHPGFVLVISPWVILLSFIILTLAILVSLLIIGKFNVELRKITATVGSGIHHVDVNRIGTAITAFRLGIANLRKRKARTILTAVSLIVLTFTILSFTSVRTYIRENRYRLNHPPGYNGLLIRDQIWEPFPEHTVRVLKDEFTDRTKYKLSPRNWLFSDDPTRRAMLELKFRDKTYTVNSICGFTADEVVPFTTTLHPAGRWFLPEDRQVCIIPDSVAQSLGITDRDMGRVSLNFWGRKLQVIGILNETKVNRLVDLDNESPLPIDFSRLKPEVMSTLGQVRGKRFDRSVQPKTQMLEYVHLPPNQTVFVDYKTVRELGGTLRSVAIQIPDLANVYPIVHNLLKRMALYVYVGQKTETILYSSLGLTSFTGLENVFIPILIAAFIVLNTMLGSVYERNREIGIFSAVGLAPVQIAILFLAESCVFANLGAITGYLLGQVTAGVLSRLNWLGELSLNYSSLSAVATTTLIMLVVLISTLYPASKAARMAVPSIERKWKLPEPVGDKMEIMLPFTLTREDVLPCALFLKEYFDGYIDFVSTDFSAEELGFIPRTDDTGGYDIKMKVWLAPYDMGVSQQMKLSFTRSEKPEIYLIYIYLTRTTGDLNSWFRTNRLFLDLLRKQFLVWRTVTPSRKQDYVSKFMESEKNI